MRLGKLRKRKGKVRELEWVHFLKEHGVESARRTSQYNGKEGSSDVVADELKGFYMEVKGVENLNIWEAVERVMKEKKDPALIGIVAHRKNRSGWMVYMDAEEWLKLAKIWVWCKILKDNNRFLIYDEKGKALDYANSTLD